MDAIDGFTLLMLGINVILLFSTALLTSVRTLGEIVDTRIINYVNVVYNIYGEMIWTRGSPGLKVPSAE